MRCGCCCAQSRNNKIRNSKKDTASPTQQDLNYLFIIKSCVCFWRTEELVVVTWSCGWSCYGYYDGSNPEMECGSGNEVGIAARYHCAEVVLVLLLIE